MKSQIQRFKWHQAILLVVAAMALVAAPAAAQNQNLGNLGGAGTPNKVPLWTGTSTLEGSMQ